MIVVSLKSDLTYFFGMKALQTHTHNNIATLLYSPWEKIDVKSHSKVRSPQSEVHKCVSIL